MIWDSGILEGTMRQDLWTLKGKKPVPCDDILVWSSWMESANRHVAETRIKIDGEDPEIRISTTFLGIDHSHGGPEPVLFETMAFDGEDSRFQKQYRTWGEAYKGHWRLVALIMSVIDQRRP
jgi:hypothetical protein